MTVLTQSRPLASMSSTKNGHFGANALVQSGRPKTCQGTDLDAEAGLKNPLGADWVVRLR